MGLFLDAVVNWVTHTDRSGQLFRIAVPDSDADTDAG